jgi:hypothetical protein
MMQNNSPFFKTAILRIFFLVIIICVVIVVVVIVVVVAIVIFHFAIFLAYPKFYRYLRH